MCQSLLILPPLALAIVQRPRPTCKSAIHRQIWPRTPFHVSPFLSPPSLSSLPDRPIHIPASRTPPNKKRLRVNTAGERSLPPTSSVTKVLATRSATPGPSSTPVVASSPAAVKTPDVEMPAVRPHADESAGEYDDESVLDPAVRLRDARRTARHG
jgi:hypothetical protein